MKVQQEKKIDNKLEQSAEKTKKNKKSFKEFMGSFKSRNFKGGMFAFCVSLAVIVFVVVINLVFTKLDVTADLTTNSLYSISDETVEFAKSISDTIRIYYFAETGSENEQIKKIVDKYDGLGSDMKVVYVDPVLHPNYASGLVGSEAASQVGTDTVIVVNETNGRSKLMLDSELIVTDYSFDYSTYQYNTTYSVNVENEIDSALLYVTTENTPKVYYTTGHGETAPADTFATLLEDNLFETAELDTMVSTEVPSDCDILLINIPTADFTEEEITMIKAYLAAGGKAVINCAYVSADHPNFLSLLEYYGLSFTKGIVIETDSKYYRSGNSSYLLPTVGTADVTSGVKGVKRVFVPMASGLKETADVRSTITVTELLTTTAGSYSKIDETTSTNENVEGVDVDGPFIVGAYVTETVEAGTTELYVYSSPYIWDESIITSTSYGNSKLLINSFTTLANVEETFTVAAKSLDSGYISLTEAQISLHRNIKMILLPAACLIAGIVIYIMRRRAV